MGALQLEENCEALEVGALQLEENQLPSASKGPSLACAWGLVKPPFQVPPSLKWKVWQGVFQAPQSLCRTCPICSDGLLQARLTSHLVLASHSAISRQALEAQKNRKFFCLLQASLLQAQKVRSQVEFAIGKEKHMGIILFMPQKHGGLYLCILKVYS